MAELVLRPGHFQYRAGSRDESLSEGSGDEALAERVRSSGDVAAFSMLVTRYRGRLIALARRMLPGSSSDEAEDMAQEAFVAAYAKRTSFRKGEPFRPWLYKIAVNRCLDRLRALSRRPVTIEIGSLSEPKTFGNGPEELLLSTENEARLQAAVAALPPKLRAVFVLRHLDDLSYEEIATATGLPLGTVKTHLFRARAELRTALAEYLKP